MWSSVISCCNNCLLWAQPSAARKALVKQKSDAGRTYAGAQGHRSSVSWAVECLSGDEVDGDVDLRSRSALKSSRSMSGRKKGKEDPFKNVDRNQLRRQSVKSRRDSSSSTDISSVLTGSRSSIASLDKVDSNFPRAQQTRKPRRDKRVVLGGSAPPSARTVAVTLQPRGEEIFRPDLAQPKSATKASPGTRPKESRRVKTEGQRSPSISSSLGSNKDFRKTTQAPFISPQEAASVAVDNRPPSGGSQAPDGALVSNSIFQWLSNSQNEKKSATQDEVQRIEGVTGKSSLARLVGLVSRDQAGAQASYQYQATSVGGLSKVHLRSKATVQSIGAKKASKQSQSIAQYTFGFICIAYKFSKEKKLEVDVLKVAKLPKYEASLFGDDHDNGAKVPSLKYVDIEVCLQLSKGKGLTHKIKKFRTGEDDTDDLPFEPECCFRHKDLEDCLLVLSVNRRQKNLVAPKQSVGHALLKLSRQNVQAPGVIKQTLPLKHGTLRQDVKGSVLLVLKCGYPAAKTVELCLEVRLVQYLNVAALGISHGTPDFKVKPEIKIKAQLIGSEKSGSSRAREFPWIGLQNNTSLSRRQEEGAGDFGGWGTLFPEGCSVSRTVLDSELKAMTLSFVVQVYGRNNAGPAVKKEVLLGTVVLGPELKCSPEFPTSVEDGTLTHWGEAVVKRTAVEQLHRLHL